MGKSRKQLLLSHQIIDEPHTVSQKPTNGYRPPDADHADGRNRGQQISQRYSGTKGDNGKNDRHPRLSQSPIQAIEQKQAADATAKYQQLAQFLIVKYLDGNMKREENGKFNRTEDGYPASPKFPGYDERYYRSIVNDAGERLRVKTPQL